MRAVIANKKRDNLFQEISDAVRQWSEHERRIFSQAHYKGQSLEAISHALRIGVEEVSAILKQCDRRLHAALRNLRTSSREKPAVFPAEPSCPSDCGKDPKAVHAFNPKINCIPHTYRKSA
jgi:hypothetical protein